MTRKPAVLWAAVCAALFAGCIDAPTAPGATPDERAAPAAFSMSSILAENVDDVLTRVLPSLAPHAGQGLEAQLRDLRAALNGGSIDRLNDALGAAELGLLQLARKPQVRENAADLDVIRLTVSRVSALSAIVNTALGGGSTPYTIADLNQTAFDVNNAFNNGVTVFAQQHLFNGACP